MTNFVVNCEWSDWQMQQCSVTCGGGTRANIRAKTVEEKNGGVCTGELTVEEVCNMQDCPGKINSYSMYLIDSISFSVDNKLS